MDNDADGGQGLGIVGWTLADANEVGNVVFFEYGDVGGEGLVGGTVEDEEWEVPDLYGTYAESWH